MRIVSSRILGPYRDRGFVLELCANDGSIGRGECAPLAGYSRETLADAKRVLQSVHTRLATLENERVTPGDVATAERAVAVCMAPIAQAIATIPSARFAIEVALCDLITRAHGVSLAALLGARPFPATPAIKWNAIVSLTEPTRIEEAKRLVAEGYSVLKAKIGRGNPSEELAAARELRDALGMNVKLRFDANGAYDVEGARKLLAAFVDVRAEYIEEPTHGAGLLELGGDATPWAADESLEDRTLAERLLRAEGCRAFVLKPARLGLFRSLQLAKQANEAGRGAVVTHMRDGNIGLAAARALAEALAPNVLACGLADHVDLVHWDASISATATATTSSVLSATQLRESADQLAPALSGHLRDRDPSAPVAVVATNRPATLATIIALINANIPFVPLHPRLTAHEREALIATARASHTLDDETIDSLQAHPNAAGRAPAVPQNPHPSDPLAVLFTSGTTGTPRGAILSHRAFAASAEANAANLSWRPSDRWLLAMPVCHIGGLSILTRVLRANRTLVLQPRFDAEAVLTSIVRDHVTIISVVPTMLADLLAADRNNVLQALRAVLVGGAAASPALLAECHASNVSALATYGLTEACSQVASQRLHEPPATSGVGRALPGMELKVDQGHIHIRGPARMSGYLGSPVLAPDEWFDTGDLGEIDDRGTLYVHARRSDLIVTGGENVYPREVEVALEACAGVRRAVVVGLPDSRWGHVVAAMVEPRDANAPTSEALHAELAQSLAPFKRPKHIAFTREWPMLGGTKIDRRQVAYLIAKIR